MILDLIRYEWVRYLTDHCNMTFVDELRNNLDETAYKIKYFIMGYVCSQDLPGNKHNNQTYKKLSDEVYGIMTNNSWIPDASWFPRTGEE